MHKSKSEKRLISSGIAVATLSLAIFSFSVGDVYAQASDFFSNTQSTDKRAGTGAAIAAPGSIGATNPGFNPCSGAGATLTAGECTGVPDASSLLSSGNLTATFQESGPGAITDNMFGLVSGTALGSDGLAGGVGAAADTPTTNCAPAFGTAGFDTSALGGLNGLNCGALRITPVVQGMTIPTFPVTNSLDQELTGSANLNFDSSPATNTHTGFDILNRFVWIPGTAVGSGTPIACAADAGGSAATPNFCSDQKMRQVTAINGVGGTQAVPVPAADQVVDLTTVFQTLAEDDVTAFPAAAFNVVVTGTITDPDMSGTSGTGFSQTIGLTFSHNALSGTDTQVFTCVAQGAGLQEVGCSDYPTAITQTVGNTTAQLP